MKSGKPKVSTRIAQQMFADHIQFNKMKIKFPFFLSPHDQLV
jgi:hypothetical protein